MEMERTIIIGNFDRVEQIIRNLLKNVLRVIENRTIRVGVEEQSLFFWILCCYSSLTVSVNV